MATGKSTRSGRSSGSDDRIPVRPNQSGDGGWQSEGADLASEKLGKAIALVALCNVQLDTDLKPPCDYIWFLATFERAIELVREIDTMSTPDDIGQAVHRVRGTGELLRIAMNEVGGNGQFESDETISWALWALRDDMRSAKGLVDAHGRCPAPLQPLQ